MSVSLPTFVRYLSEVDTPYAVSGETAVDLLGSPESQMPILSAYSRNGRIGGRIRLLCEHLKLGDLRFLYSPSWYSGGEIYTKLLRGEELSLAFTGITTLLGKIGPHPRACDENGGWWEYVDAQHLAAAKARPLESPTVDDGTDYASLVAFLFSLRHYCEHALEHGGSLLYVQFQYS